jgi:hypothetical protein
LDLYSRSWRRNCENSLIELILEELKGIMERRRRRSSPLVAWPAPAPAMSRRQSRPGSPGERNEGRGEKNEREREGGIGFARAFSDGTDGVHSCGTHEQRGRGTRGNDIKTFLFFFGRSGIHHRVTRCGSVRRRVTRVEESVTRQNSLFGINQKRDLESSKNHETFLEGSMHQA